QVAEDEDDERQRDQERDHRAWRQQAVFQRDRAQRPVLGGVLGCGGLRLIDGHAARCVSSSRSCRQPTCPAITSAQSRLMTIPMLRTCRCSNTLCAATATIEPNAPRTTALASDPRPYRESSTRSARAMTLPSKVR